MIIFCYLTLRRYPCRASCMRVVLQQAVIEFYRSECTVRVCVCVYVMAISQVNGYRKGLEVGKIFRTSMFDVSIHRNFKHRLIFDIDFQIGNIVTSMIIGKTSMYYILQKNAQKIKILKIIEIFIF